MPAGGDDDVAHGEGRIAGQARTKVSDERCIERTMPWSIGMTKHN
jgi:hypothetical protein